MEAVGGGGFGVYADYIEAAWGLGAAVLGGQVIARGAQQAASLAGVYAGFRAAVCAVAAAAHFYEDEGVLVAHHQVDFSLAAAVVAA